MKKIALFAAALCFTVGMAMAQQPTKTTQTAAKPNTEKATTATQTQQSCTHHCGGCPHHACQTAQPTQSTQQVKANTTATPSCDKSTCDKKSEGTNNKATKKDSKKDAAKKQK